MKYLFHIVSATLAFMIGMAVGFVLSVVGYGVIFAFVFGMLGFIAGIFNGTDSLYIYQTASDGFMLSFFINCVYVIIQFFRRYPEALGTYMNSSTVLESLRG